MALLVLFSGILAPKWVVSIHSRLNEWSIFIYGYISGQCSFAPKRVVHIRLQLHEVHSKDKLPFDLWELITADFLTQQQSGLRLQYIL